jgi:hypothetical protein
MTAASGAPTVINGGWTYPSPALLTAMNTKRAVANNADINASCSRSSHQGAVFVGRGFASLALIVHRYRISGEHFDALFRAALMAIR